MTALPVPLPYVVRYLLLFNSIAIHAGESAKEFSRWIRPDEFFTLGQYYDASRDIGLVKNDVHPSNPDYDPGCNLSELNADSDFTYDCYLKQMPYLRQDVNRVNYAFSNVKTQSQQVKSLGFGGSASLNLVQGGMDLSVSASGGFLDETMNFEKKQFVSMDFTFISHIISLDHERILKPNSAELAQARDIGATHFVRDIMFGGMLRLQIIFDSSMDSEKKIVNFMGELSLVVGSEEPEEEGEEEAGDAAEDGGDEAGDGAEGEDAAEEGGDSPPETRRRKRKKRFVQNNNRSFLQRLIDHDGGSSWKFSIDKSGLPSYDEPFIPLHKRGYSKKELKRARQVEALNVLKASRKQLSLKSEIDCFELCDCPCLETDLTCQQNCDFKCLQNCELGKIGPVSKPLETRSCDCPIDCMKEWECDCKPEDFKCWIEKECRHDHIATCINQCDCCDPKDKSCSHYDPCWCEMDNFETLGYKDGNACNCESIERQKRQVDGNGPVEEIADTTVIGDEDNGFASTFSGSGFSGQILYEIHRFIEDEEEAMVRSEMGSGDIDTAENASNERLVYAEGKGAMCPDGDANQEDEEEEEEEEEEEGGEEGEEDGGDEEGGDDAGGDDAGGDDAGGDDAGGDDAGGDDAGGDDAGGDDAGGDDAEGDDAGGDDAAEDGGEAEDGSGSGEEDDEGIELSGRGCININDYQLSSVSGLEIRIMGIPTVISTPLSIVDAIYYIREYKDYLKDELQNEGVPIKVGVGEIKQLTPGLIETLFYLPQAQQVNSAIDMLDDFSRSIAFWDEHRPTFETYARNNVEISQEILSVTSKQILQLMNTRSALLADFMSLNLDDPRVDMTETLKRYYRSTEATCCSAGEFRWIRSYNLLLNQLMSCQNTGSSGYCNGHGKCIMRETQGCIGVHLVCECERGWSSEDMDVPGRCDHNVCELDGRGEGGLCGAGTCIPDIRRASGYRCQCDPGSYGEHCELSFCDIQSFRDVCENGAKQCMPRTDLTNGPYYSCLCDNKFHSMKDGEKILNVDYDHPDATRTLVKESDNWKYVGVVPDNLRTSNQQWIIRIDNATSTVEIRFSNIEVILSANNVITGVTQNGESVDVNAMEFPLRNKGADQVSIWFRWDIETQRFSVGEGVLPGKNTMIFIYQRHVRPFTFPLQPFIEVSARVRPFLDADSPGSDAEKEAELSIDHSATIILPIIRKFQDIDGYNCEFKRCNDNNDNRRRTCRFRGYCRNENEVTNAIRQAIKHTNQITDAAVEDLIAEHFSTKGYVCECDAGWYGPDCQYHVCDDSKNLCQQHGLKSKCIHSVDCRDGYWSDLDNRYYTQDNAACITDRTVAFRCVECASGWHGPKDEGQCQVSPCFESTYNWTRQELYSGSKTLVNKCTTVTTNAFCVATVDESEDYYQCICPPGYAGRHCEINECENFNGEQYCLNNGVCEISDEGPICACPAQSYGKRCENTICNPHLTLRGIVLDSPCKHGSECIITETYPYFDCVETSVCRDDNQAPPSERTCQIDACSDSQKERCEQDSLCVLDVNESDGFRCECTRPWQRGDYCRPVNRCDIDDHKCPNHATCIVDYTTPQGYRCQCDAYHLGNFCEYTNDCPDDKWATLHENALARTYELTCEDSCNAETHYSTNSTIEIATYAGQGQFIQDNYNMKNHPKYCLPCHPDCVGCSAPYGLGYCDKCKEGKLLYQHFGKSECVELDRCVDTPLQSFWVEEGVCKECHPACRGSGCTQPNNENYCKENHNCLTKVLISGIRPATAKAALTLALIDPDANEHFLRFQITPARSYYLGCLEQQVEVTHAKLRVTEFLSDETNFEWWIKSIEVDYNKEGGWRAIPLVGMGEDLTPSPFKKLLLTDNNFDRISEDDITANSVIFESGEESKTVITNHPQNFFEEGGSGYFVLQITAVESVLVDFANIRVRLAGKEGVSKIMQFCDNNVEDCAVLYNETPYLSSDTMKTAISSAIKPLATEMKDVDRRLFWFSYNRNDSSVEVGLGGQPGTYPILRATFINRVNNFQLPFEIAPVTDVKIRFDYSILPYMTEYPESINRTGTAYILDNGSSFSSYKILREYLGSTHVCSGAIGDDCWLTVPRLTPGDKFEEKVGCDNNPLPVGREFFVYRGNIYHVPKATEENRVESSSDALTECKKLGDQWSLWCPKPDEFEIMKMGWGTTYLSNQGYFTGYEVGEITQFDLEYDYVHEDVQIRSNWWTCQGPMGHQLMSKYYIKDLPDLGSGEDVCLRVSSENSYAPVDCDSQQYQNNFFVCQWECNAEVVRTQQDSEFCLMFDEERNCILLDCPVVNGENWMPTMDKNTCVPHTVPNCMGYYIDEFGVQQCGECKEGMFLEQNQCLNPVKFCVEYDINISTIIKIDGEYRTHGCIKCEYGMGLTVDHQSCITEIVGCKYHAVGGGCFQCLNQFAKTKWRTCRFVLEGTRNEQLIGTAIADIYPEPEPGKKSYVRQAEGRIKTTIDGGNIWGTVCDDGFDEREATVACMEMGFRHGTPLQRELVEEGSDDQLIVYDNLQCSLPTMSRLFDCYNQGVFTHDCTHEEDVGVQCFHKTFKKVDHDWRSNITDDNYQVFDDYRIIGDASYGRVEVRTDLFQPWQSECSLETETDDMADKVCRFAGFTGGFQTVTEKVRPAPFGQFRQCEEKGDDYIPLGVECFPHTTCRGENCARLLSPVKEPNCPSGYHWDGDKCMCNTPTDSGYELIKIGDKELYIKSDQGSYPTSCSDGGYIVNPDSYDEFVRYAQKAKSLGKTEFWIDSDLSNGYHWSSDYKNLTSADIIPWCSDPGSSGNRITVIIEEIDGNFDLCFRRRSSATVSNSIASFCIWKSTDCVPAKASHVLTLMDTDEDHDGLQNLGFVETSTDFGKSFHKVLSSFSPKHYTLSPNDVTEAREDALESMGCVHVHVLDGFNNAENTINIKVFNGRGDEYNFGSQGGQAGYNGDNGKIHYSQKNPSFNHNLVYDPASVHTQQKWCMLFKGRPYRAELTVGNGQYLRIDLQFHYQNLVYRFGCPSEMANGNYEIRLTQTSTDRCAKHHGSSSEIGVVLDPRYDIDRGTNADGIQMSRTFFAMATCNGLGFKQGYEKTTFINHMFNELPVPEGFNAATWLSQPVREAMWFQGYLMIAMNHHDLSKTRDSATNINGGFESPGFEAECPEHTFRVDIDAIQYDYVSNYGVVLNPAQVTILKKIFSDKHFTSNHIQIGYVESDTEDLTPWNWFEQSFYCFAEPGKENKVIKKLAIPVDTGFDRLRSGGREVEHINLDTTVGSHLKPVVSSDGEINFYKFRLQSKYPVKAILYSSKESFIEGPDSVDRYPHFAYEKSRWQVGQCSTTGMTKISDGRFDLSDLTFEDCFNSCKEYDDWTGCQTNPEGFEAGCYVSTSVLSDLVNESRADQLYRCYHREFPSDIENSVTLKNRPSFEIWINEPYMELGFSRHFSRILACGVEVATLATAIQETEKQSQSFYISWINGKLLLGNGHTIGDRVLLSLADYASYCDKEFSITDLAFAGIESTLDHAIDANGNNHSLPPPYVTDTNDISFGGTLSSRNPRIQSIDYGVFEKITENSVDFNGKEIIVVDCDKRYDFFSAKARCQQLGGELIDVDSFDGPSISVNKLAEVSMLFADTCKTTNTNFFVDLMYSCRNERWEKRNGQEFTDGLYFDEEQEKLIKYWAPDQPTSISTDSCVALDKCGVTITLQDNLSDFGFISSGCSYDLPGAVCMMPKRNEIRPEFENFADASDLHYKIKFSELIKSAVWYEPIDDENVAIIPTCDSSRDFNICELAYTRENLDFLQTNFGSQQAYIDENKEKYCVNKKRATACILKIPKTNMKFSLDNTGDIGNSLYLDKVIRNKLALKKQFDSDTTIGYPTHNIQTGKKVKMGTYQREREAVYFALQFSDSKNYVQSQRECRQIHPRANLYEPSNAAEIQDIFAGFQNSCQNGQSNFCQINTYLGVRVSLTAMGESDYYQTSNKQQNFIYESTGKKMTGKILDDIQSTFNVNDHQVANVISLASNNGVVSMAFADLEGSLNGAVCQISVSSNVEKDHDLEYVQYSEEELDIDTWQYLPSIGGHLAFVVANMYASDADIHCKSLHERARLWEPKENINEIPDLQEYVTDKIGSFEFWTGFSRNPHTVFDIRGNSGPISYLPSSHRFSQSSFTKYDSSEDPMQFSSSRSDMVVTTSGGNSNFVDSRSTKRSFFCEIPGEVQEEKIFVIPTCQKSNFKQARATCKALGGDLMKNTNVKKVKGESRLSSFSKALLQYNEVCDDTSGIWTGAQITCNNRNWHWVSDDRFEFDPIVNRFLFSVLPSNDMNAGREFHNQCSSIIENFGTDKSMYIGLLRLHGTNMCLDFNDQVGFAAGPIKHFVACEDASEYGMVMDGSSFTLVNKFGASPTSNGDNIFFTASINPTLTEWLSLPSNSLNFQSWNLRIKISKSNGNKLTFGKNGLVFGNEDTYWDIYISKECDETDEDGNYVETSKSCSVDSAGVMTITQSLSIPGLDDYPIDDEFGVVCVLSSQKSLATQKFDVDYSPSYKFNLFETKFSSVNGGFNEYYSKVRVSSNDIEFNSVFDGSVSSKECAYRGASKSSDQICKITRGNDYSIERYISRPAKPYLGDVFDCYMFTEYHPFQCSITGMPHRNTPTINYLAFSNVRPGSDLDRLEGPAEQGWVNRFEYFYENTAGLYCMHGWKPCKDGQIRNQMNQCVDRDECEPYQDVSATLKNPLNHNEDFSVTNVRNPEYDYPGAQVFDFRNGELNYMCAGSVAASPEDVQDYRIGSQVGFQCRIAGPNGPVIKDAEAPASPTDQDAHDKDHYYILNEIDNQYSYNPVHSCFYEFFASCRDGYKAQVTQIERDYLLTKTASECNKACAILTAGCWTWTASNERCECFSSEDLEDNLSPVSDSVLSGLVNAWTPGYKKCSMATGNQLTRDRFFVEDTGNRAETSKLCQKLCLMDMDCQFWQLENSVRLCQLAEDIGSYQKNPDFTTGSDICGMLSNTDSDCIETPGKGVKTDLVHYAEVSSIESTFLTGADIRNLLDPARYTSTEVLFHAMEESKIFLGMLNHENRQASTRIKDNENYRIRVYVKSAQNGFKIRIGGCTFMPDTNWPNAGLNTLTRQNNKQPWHFSCQHKFNSEAGNYLGIRVDSEGNTVSHVKISGIYIDRGFQVSTQVCREPSYMFIRSAFNNKYLGLYDGGAYAFTWGQAFRLIPTTNGLYAIYSQPRRRFLCMNTLVRNGYDNQEIRLSRPQSWWANIDITRDYNNNICTFKIKKQFVNSNGKWRYSIEPKRINESQQRPREDNEKYSYALVCGNNIAGRPSWWFGYISKKIWPNCWFAARVYSRNEGRNVGVVDYNNDWVYYQSLFAIESHSRNRNPRNPNCLSNEYLYDFAASPGMKTRVEPNYSQYNEAKRLSDNYPIYAGKTIFNGKEYGGTVDGQTGTLSFVTETDTEGQFEVESVSNRIFYYTFDDCCEGGICTNLVGNRETGLFEGEIKGVNAYYQCECPPGHRKLLKRYGVYTCVNTKNAGRTSFCVSGQNNPHHHTMQPTSDNLETDCVACLDPNHRIDPNDPTRCVAMESYCKFGESYNMQRDSDLSSVFESIWRYNQLGHNYEQCKPGSCQRGYHEVMYTLNVGTAEFDDRVQPLNAMKCSINVCYCDNGREGYGESCFPDNYNPNNDNHYCVSCNTDYDLINHKCWKATWELAPNGNIGFVKLTNRNKYGFTRSQEVRHHYEANRWYHHVSTRHVMHRRWDSRRITYNWRRDPNGNYYHFRGWRYGWRKDIVLSWYWYWYTRFGTRYDAFWRFIYGRSYYDQWLEPRHRYEYNVAIRGYPVVKLVRLCDSPMGCQYMWGSVCDDGFGRNEARSFCRNLGYDDYCAWMPGKYARIGSRFLANGGRGLRRRPDIARGFAWGIALDDLRCGGPRMNIGSQCEKRQYGKHNCHHWEDVILECIHP